MITSNIFRDFKFKMESSPDRRTIHAYLHHKFLPLTFSHSLYVPSEAEIFPYIKENVDLLIHQLYKEVLDCALHGRPYPFIHTGLFVPCWSDESQAWYYIDKNGDEVFTIEGI